MKIIFTERGWIQYVQYTRISNPGPKVIYQEKMLSGIDWYSKAPPVQQPFGLVYEYMYVCTQFVFSTCDIVVIGHMEWSGTLYWFCFSSLTLPQQQADKLPEKCLAPTPLLRADQNICHGFEPLSPLTSRSSKFFLTLKGYIQRGCTRACSIYERT